MVPSVHNSKMYLQMYLKYRKYIEIVIELQIEIQITFHMVTKYKIHAMYFKMYT